MPKFKRKIRNRVLIGMGEAANLEATFKVLANATRLRMLHALVRNPNMCVGDLAETVGMKIQAISNQLQRLVDKGIVVSRRNGTQMHCQIVDPCVVHLLDRGLCLSEDLPNAKKSAMRNKAVGGGL